jgi:hypothetical protein
MPEAKKKRNCVICETEHNVGEPCPECEWDQEKEERLAKGEEERKRLREKQNAPKKKDSGFWS